MNENLNLVEILKDCPRGTKLYSTVFGEAEFKCIEKDAIYPIIVRADENNDCRFAIDGRVLVDFDGECTLFPSKDQRDWSKFNPKKEELAPPCKFKVGDWVVFNGFTLYIKEVVKGFYRTISKGGISNSYDWDIDNIARLWVIQDAKEGDVLEFGDHGRLVVGVVSYINKRTGKVDAYCLLEDNKFKLGFYYNLDTINPHPATQEQRDALMKAMNDAGYVWDEKKNELRELIKPKFDPKALQPFDRVLVKNSGFPWRCDIFSYYQRNKRITCHCISDDYIYDRCIPYNEDTKHLVGTTEEAPEFYRYWED